MKRVRTQVQQARLLLLYALFASAIISCTLSIVLITVIKTRDKDALKQHRAIDAGQLVLALEHQLNQRAPDTTDIQQVSPYVLDYELRHEAYRVDVSSVCLYSRALTLVYANDKRLAPECTGQQRQLKTALQNESDSVVTRRRNTDIYFVKTFIPIHNRRHEIIGVAEIWVDITYVLYTFSRSTNQALVILTVLTLGFTALLLFIGEVLVRRMREVVAAQLRSEEELERSLSLARVGLMVAGLSHQLRNPLSILSGIAASLNRRAMLEEQRPFLRALTEETDRMQRLSEVFLDFAKPIQLNLQLCNVSEMVQRVVALLKSQAPGAQVQTQGPTWLEVTMDCELIFQTLVNIALNSVEALEHNKIPQISINFNVTNDVLLIEVLDNGAGFSLEQLERLQSGPQPFYSTKTKGSGLGLAIADKIAAAHAGRIDLANRPAGGAKVTLSLPIQGINK